MDLGSIFTAPTIIKQQQPTFRAPLRFPAIFVQKSKIMVTWNKKSNKLKVCCSQVKVVDNNNINDDEEACELVNGTELTIGDECTRAYFFTAVKNNNAIGILLLSDIFGFEDSSTQDFAYRLACNGYNVLVPDLFKGDPWTKHRPKALLEEWITKHNPKSKTKTIFESAKWMINEFASLGISRKLGIIGFCYGGGRVIETLAQDQGALFGSGVSFYGTRIESFVVANNNINVPLLMITGDDDAICSVDSLVDIKKSCKNNELMRIEVFKGRGHGFAHRPRTVDEDEDAEKAFMMMRNWLHHGLMDEKVELISL